MTHQEKALELVGKYERVGVQGTIEKHYAKQCALIDNQNTIDKLDKIQAYGYMESEKITGMILELRSVSKAITEL